MLYTPATTKQILLLCKKSLEHKEKVIKHRDFISSNVVYVNPPTEKPKIEIKIGPYDKGRK